MLIVTGDPSTVHKTAADWSDRVDVVAGTWAEDGGPEAVLLRPDGHVVWAAPDGGDVTDALTRWFGAAAV